VADVPRRVLVEVLFARTALPNVSRFLRQIDAELPTVGENDLRVKPYTVLYPSAGAGGYDVRLGGDMVGLGTSFQITCAAGEEKAVDLLVDAVTARFDEWRPQLPAPYDLMPIGRCRLLNDPGPAQRDDDESPARFWTPLVYGLLVNN
jgi:hypothetical protein